MRYESLIRLGGAMADVYYGVLHGAEGFRRPVVLKRAPPHRPEARSPLIREAQIGAVLHHANIVHVFELVETELGLTLSMEYLPGASVERLMTHIDETDGSLPWHLASRIVADVARGLHHAHVAVDFAGQPLAIAHRDISPKNLLVTDQGLTKIVDFGIARSALAAESHRAGFVVGTVAYLSPEQARGEPLDWRTDVFSLGVVLHELLSHARLFAREDVAATMEAICSAPIPTLSPDLPPVLGDLCTALLQRDPAHRYRTMAEVADILDDVSAGRGGTHEAVAMFLSSELGAALEQRTRRLRSLLTESPAPQSFRGDLTLRGTLQLLERALDTIQPDSSYSADDVDTEVAFTSAPRHEGG